MSQHAVHRRMTVGVLVLTVLLAGSIGCKKKLPKEAPPPSSPKVEEVQQVPVPDTTGQAEQELQRLMEADRSRIRTVYFDFDQSAIRADQLTGMSANAEVFRKWPAWQITIEGHCDERGTTEYNLALGERRATSAKKALVAAGVDASRIRTVSFGEERAADSGHNEAAWSKNRRAEFRVK